MVDKVELPQAIVAFLDQSTDECTHGSISLVRIREPRLDHATSTGRVTSLIAEHLSPQAIVIVDLASVTYISSAGLRELMVAAKPRLEAYKGARAAPPPQWRYPSRLPAILSAQRRQRVKV